MLRDQPSVLKAAQLEIRRHKHVATIERHEEDLHEEKRKMELLNIV